MIRKNFLTIVTEAEKMSLINNLRTRHRVDVLAFKDDLLLAYLPEDVTQRPEVPGGGVDQEDFDLVKAAERETMEESGWTIQNVKEVNVDYNTIFKPKDYNWLNKIGFDQEIQHTVKAEAVKYDPDKTYMSEGDGNKFSLVDPYRFINQTVYHIEISENDHWKFQACLRVASLRSILGI